MKPNELNDKELEKVYAGTNEDYNGEDPAKFHGFHLNDRVSVLDNPLGTGKETYFGTIVDWYIRGLDIRKGGYYYLAKVDLDGVSGHRLYEFSRLTKIG